MVQQLYKVAFWARGGESLPKEAAYRGPLPVQNRHYLCKLLGYRRSMLTSSAYFFAISSGVGPILQQLRTAARSIWETWGESLDSYLGKIIAAAKVYKDRCLEVHFADGSMLSVKPDVAYEAWEIAGTGGLHVVCTPGGSLSLWQPAKDGNKL